MRLPRCLTYGTALALFIGVIFTPIPSRAEITTIAEYAMILDHDSGEVLFEKNADAPMKPASLAKMMTVYLLMDRLKDGSILIDDLVTVSEKAWKKGGSRTFLEPSKKVTVSDLMRGIIVQSGNDAAIVVAEALSGTEDAFAVEMTEKAEELEMKNTVFGNSTGWPDEVTTTTARDMALLSRALIKNFPNYYPMFAEESFTYNNISQQNRNPLLGTVAGGDGLKTGHTTESGYGLAASADRDGQRVILVLNGLDSATERKQESARLINLAFRTFKKYDLVTRDEILGYVSVWMGEDGVVPLTVAEDISKILAHGEIDKVKRQVDWPSSLDAPISKGQKIGRLTLSINGVDHFYPLVAGKEVEALSFYRYPGSYMHYLIFGLETKAAPNG